MIDISVVIPIFNEQENIPILIESIKLTLYPSNFDFEIIFVDDGSTDSSLLVLKDSSQKHKEVKYLSLSRNFGQQAALIAGLDFAKGKAVITMDADFQDPPELIPMMIQKWQEGYNVVYTMREHRNDTFFKRNSARFYYFLLNKFSDLNDQGNVGEFRLVDRQVLDELLKIREKTRYLRGIVNWMGFRHTFIAYDRPRRKFGISGFSMLNMTRLAMSGILNFSLLPLRLGLVIGMFVIILGLFFLGYIFYDVAFNHEVYPLYKWLSVVTFIFTGLLFIFIWIIGEYIGKIYNETKDRPIYLLQEKGNIE
jgi:glycosyltransferase involved in cell wall biosynthesis